MKQAIGQEWAYQVLNQVYSSNKESAGVTTTSRVWRDGEWRTIEHKLGDTRGKKAKFITCERDRNIGSDRK